MTLLFLILDVAVAILVTLATTIQVLYLESLRIRARELSRGCTRISSHRPAQD